MDSDLVAKTIQVGFPISLQMIISVVIWLFAPDIIILFNLSDQAAVYCLKHLRAVAIYLDIVLSLVIQLFGGMEYSDLESDSL